METLQCQGSSTREKHLQKGTTLILGAKISLTLVGVDIYYLLCSPSMYKLQEREKNVTMVFGSKVTT